MFNIQLYKIYIQLDRELINRQVTAHKRLRQVARSYCLARMGRRSHPQCTILAVGNIRVAACAMA